MYKYILLLLFLFKYLYLKDIQINKVEMFIKIIII